MLACVLHLTVLDNKDALIQAFWKQLKYKLVMSLKQTNQWTVNVTQENPAHSLPLLLLLVGNLTLQVIQNILYTSPSIHPIPWTHYENTHIYVHTHIYMVIYGLYSHRWSVLATGGHPSVKMLFRNIKMYTIPTRSYMHTCIGQLGVHLHRPWHRVVLDTSYNGAWQEWQLRQQPKHTAFAQCLWSGLRAAQTQWN